MDVRQDVIVAMMNDLNKEQLDKLKFVLDKVLYDYDIKPKETALVVYDDDNMKVVKKYVACKRIEGLSENTLKQYHRTIVNFLETIGKPIKEITVYDIRFIFAEYQARGTMSMTSIVNQQRYLSSFFSWLVDEEIIKVNPMKKIGRIKTPKKIRAPFTEEEMEKLRTGATTLRDRALIEFLYSTGCRVSEVVPLNLSDVDLTDKSVIVDGKGEKERVVYLSVKTVYHLERYLAERTDNEDALFVGKRGRLTKDGMEYIVGKIGERVGVKAFPHKFRHSIATDLLRKGVPVQQVKDLLGHESIETTMGYCEVDKDSVRYSHQRYA